MPILFFGSFSKACGFCNDPENTPNIFRHFVYRICQIELHFTNSLTPSYNGNLQEIITNKQKYHYQVYNAHIYFGRHFCRQLCNNLQTKRFKSFFYLFNQKFQSRTVLTVGQAFVQFLLLNRITPRLENTIVGKSQPAARLGTAAPKPLKVEINIENTCVGNQMYKKFKTFAKLINYRRKQIGLYVKKKHPFGSSCSQADGCGYRKGNLVSKWYCQ